VLVKVLHVASLQIGLFDLVFGMDALVVDEPGLQVLELEAELGGQVARRLEIAIDDVVELLVLADDHHALAHFAVLDRSHETSVTFGNASSALIRGTPILALSNERSGRDRQGSRRSAPGLM